MSLKHTQGDSDTLVALPPPLRFLFSRLSKPIPRLSEQSEGIQVRGIGSPRYAREDVKKGKSPQSVHHTPSIRAHIPVFPSAAKESTF